MEREFTAIHQIIQHINKNGGFIRANVQREFGLVNLGMKTFDNYRRRLEVIGYLVMVKPGEYKQVKPIPEDLTTNQIMKEYKKAVHPWNDEHYDKDWNRIKN